MRVLGIIPVAAAGLLAAFWRAHLHRTLQSKVHQDSWIAWLCWAFIFVLCKIRSRTQKHRYLGLQDEDAQVYSKPVLSDFKIYGLVLAIGVTQIAQSLGNLDLTAVSPPSLAINQLLIIFQSL